MSLREYLADLLEGAGFDELAEVLLTGEVDPTQIFELAQEIAGLIELLASVGLL